MLQVVVRVGPQNVEGQTILYRDGEGRIAVVDPKHARSIDEPVSIVIVRSNDWRDQPLELSDEINPSCIRDCFSIYLDVCDSCLSGLASLC